MSKHLPELESTLRLDMSYLTPAEEELAWSDVEYLAAECRTRSRHDVVSLHAHELQRILRLCVANYSILNKVVGSMH